METKQEIEKLREEFEMARLNNHRVMTLIDKIWKENQELKAKFMMKFKDIDDEQ
jgi:hypoxanthine-guanine phosphoribosyltransferase